MTTQTAYLVDYTTNANGYNLLPNATITATGMTPANLARFYNRTKADAAQASQNTSISIVIDFGAPTAIDAIGIMGHNFTSAVTLNIEGDDDSAFGSPDVDLALTYNEDQVVYVWSSDQTYRYWRLTISDNTNSSYPWIGELVLGKLIRFTHPVTWGVSESYKFNVVTHTSDYGVPWNYYRAQTRAFESMNFEQRPDSEVTEFVTMIKASKGSFLPVLIILDTDAPNDAIFGHLTNGMQKQFVFVDWTDVNGLSVNEQPSAKTINITV